VKTQPGGVGAEEREVVRWRIRRPFSQDLGRDALGHFADDATVASEKRAPRMTLDVDEAGSDDEPRGIDAASRIRAREPAAWGDASDAVATNADIPVEPGIPGAIDDAAARDDDVKRPRIGGRACASGGARGEEYERRDKSCREAGSHWLDRGYAEPRIPFICATSRYSRITESTETFTETHREHQLQGLLSTT
jgi:hypothetical protein